MKLCDCGNQIPCRVKIDGKSRNLNNRIRCLECLPFLSKRHHKKTEEEIKLHNEKNAAKSKRYYERMKKENGINHIRHRRIMRKKLLVKIIGGCQICGYNKCFNGLSFHHLFNKQFEVSSRAMQFSYKRVMKELSKCVLICHNCHSEVHSDEIETDSNGLNKLNQDLIELISTITEDNWNGRDSGNRTHKISI